MALKGKKPEVKEKRLKLMLYGPAGVGKTCAAIQFPNSYIIDCEKGTDFYSASINKAKSVVFQTVNPDEVHDELKLLLTEKHDFKTLIIDPMTMIYNSTQEKWNRIFEKHSKNEKDKEIMDFGLRYWGKVKSNYKAIQRIMLALDMNVIVTAHQKDVYGANMSKVGVSFSSMKDDDYFFDLVFRLERRGTGRKAITVKERAEVGCNKFPEEFDWDYESFLKFYGKEIIERESVPVPMATKEQVSRINVLINHINVEDEVVNKWFNKAGVDKFDEMTSEQIEKCLKYLDKKVKEVNAK